MTEEEKIMIRNKFERVNHLLGLELTVNKELEEFKLKHEAEIEATKKTENEELDIVVKKQSEGIDKF